MVFTPWVFFHAVQSIRDALRVTVREREKHLAETRRLEDNISRMFNRLRYPKNGDEEE